MTRYVATTNDDDSDSEHNTLARVGDNGKEGRKVYSGYDTVP